MEDTTQSIFSQRFQFCQYFIPVSVSFCIGLVPSERNTIQVQKNNWPTPEEPRYRPTPIPIPITVRVRIKETPPAISNPLLLGEEVLVKASKNSGEDNIFQIFWNSCFKNSSDE